MKKMRKLLPALAMLLVSAIMMSTASFAWFTMNESVTATGMQVKAKAAGNLLISKTQLTALDKAITITFAENGKKDITPVTLMSDFVADPVGAPDTKAPAWVIPKAGSDVDQLTGMYSGDFQSIAAGSVGGLSADNTYFAEYVLYLATAGDQMTKDLYIDLTGIAGIDQNIAPAYSIAVWVGTDADVTAPTETFHYAEFLPSEGGTAGEKLVKEDVIIPSTFEKNSSNAVGLKVVIRVYIDGALQDPTKVDVETNTIKTIATGTTYGDFKDANADYDDYHFYNAAGIEVDDYNWEDDKVLTGYKYWNGTDKTTTQETVNYVNNQYIPNESTTFEIEFSAKDPATP